MVSRLDRCVRLVEALKLVSSSIREQVEYVVDAIAVVKRMAPNIGGVLEDTAGSRLKSVFGWLRILDSIADAMDVCIRREMLVRTHVYRYMRKFVDEARRSGRVLAERDGCRAVLYRNRIIFDGCWSSETSVYTYSISLADLSLVMDRLSSLDMKNLVDTVKSLVYEGRLPKKMLKIVKNEKTASLLLEVLSRVRPRGSSW